MIFLPYFGNIAPLKERTRKLLLPLIFLQGKMRILTKARTTNENIFPVILFQIFKYSRPGLFPTGTWINLQRYRMITSPGTVTITFCGIPFGTYVVNFFSK